MTPTPREDEFGGGTATDAEILDAVEGTQIQVLVHSPLRSMEVALHHSEWLKARKKKPPDVLPLKVMVHPELERLLGIGPPRLAIEYEGWGGDQSAIDEEWDFGDDQELLQVLLRVKGQGAGKG